MNEVQARPHLTPEARMLKSCDKPVSLLLSLRPGAFWGRLMSRMECVAPGGLGAVQVVPSGVKMETAIFMGLLLPAGVGFLHFPAGPGLKLFLPLAVIST
jgi:hypothetical protein